MLMFYAVMALCFSSTALAQKTGWGPCPDVDATPEFNISMMAGKWYEARRYFAAFEVGVKCVIANISDGENDSMLLDASAIYTWSGHLGEMKGIVVQMPNPNEPGKLIVKLPSTDMWHNLWILGTDYDSYVVGYSCMGSRFTHMEYLWIMTKDQEPTDAVVDEALKILDKQKLDKDSLTTTDQKDCEVKP